MRTVPRDSGRSWHTDMVNPGQGCGLAPASSAESVAKWNCTSGVFDSGSTHVKSPPWLIPTASGPFLVKIHLAPMRSFPHRLRRSSLVVIGLVHLYIRRSCR